MSHELVDAAALTSRFVLAFVFLSAAVPKLFAAHEFERAVANYALLPRPLVRDRSPPGSRGSSCSARSRFCSERRLRLSPSPRVRSSSSSHSP